jgi:hypothetical protein
MIGEISSGLRPDAAVGMTSAAVTAATTAESRTVRRVDMVSLSRKEISEWM